MFDPRTDECSAGQPPSCPQHPETILRLSDADFDQSMFGVALELLRQTNFHVGRALDQLRAGGDQNAPSGSPAP